MVGSVMEQKERPAYVRFDRVSVEDRAASALAGHYVGRDVDMAFISTPGSRDVFKQEIPQWKETMRDQVRNERMPVQWMEHYLDAYQRWTKGQEAPLTGTPIKGWGVISPAKQETLIALTVLTVEDLAILNDDGLARIGMGAVDLRQKAKAWLAQLHDKGPLTIENATLHQQVLTLQGDVTGLKEQLQRAMEQIQRGTPQAAHAVAESIAVSDLLDEPVALRSGKKR